MKPKQPENQEPQLELGKTRLENFLNLEHPLVHLAREMDWEEFGKKFGESFDDRRGRPGLPTRLMVALTYLKHAYDLSDEATIEQFLESGYWQYFCGFEYFQHESPCDSSSLTRWRKHLGEEGAEKLLTETLAVAHKLGLITLRQCERVIVDSLALLISFESVGNVMFFSCTILRSFFLFEFLWAFFDDLGPTPTTA